MGLGLSIALAGSVMVGISQTAEAASSPAAGKCFQPTVTTTDLIGHNVKIVQTCGSKAKVRYNVDCALAKDKTIDVTFPSGGQTMVTKASCGTWVNGVSWKYR
ncbi:hypothetical protein GCM10023221_11160 [Luteimicrobium xylanilyticum]|nr:hypothetical protein [Luteimicrobium xylanilyticum]